MRPDLNNLQINVFEIFEMDDVRKDVLKGAELPG